VRSLRASAAAGIVALGLLGPAAAAAEPPPTPTLPVLSVQTYELDSGADLTRLFAEPHPLLPASMVWAEMQASDIPARVRAVAQVIADRGTDLVGLQEVSTWRSAPAEFAGASVVPTGEFVTEHDALPLLLDALEALGAPYELVVADEGFTNEAAALPVVSESGLRLATFAVRDVILASRSALGSGRVTVVGTDAGAYAAQLLVSVGGTQLDLPRGWASADVDVAGRTVRFLTTHLEGHGSVELADDIRNPQATELAGIVGASPYPVVLVGDLGARPTMCSEERAGLPEYAADQNVIAYGTLEEAGLTEVWPLVHPSDPCGAMGWTSAQSRLDGATSTLDSREDHVFVSEGVTALQARVVGVREPDRTPGGLWPSDHASTWALLRLDDVPSTLGFSR
jgi:endonuclease/exonuclease/phosphatase family metal-dependent hydrolase